MKYGLQRIVFLCVVIVFINDDSYANQFRIGFSPGAGSYSQTELKNLQRSLLIYSQRQVSGVKQLEEFPGYYNYSAWMEVKFKNHSLGITFSRLSTGARNSVSDYSGRYSFDMLLYSNRYGGLYKYWFYYKPEISSFHGFTYAKYGTTHSRLHMKEELEIYDVEPYKTDYHFSASGRSFEVGLGMVYRIFSFLESNVTLGYDIDRAKDLKDVKDFQGFLKDSRGNNISTDWTGVRFTVGLNFVLDNL
jgi:hypothetical protein